MTARKPRKAVKTITAAAKRITGRRVKRPTSGMDWATEAWYYFSTCGELHYVTTTVANALSQVELYPARRTEDGWERIDDDNDPAVIALDALAGDSPTGMAEMLRRFGQNLFLAGDAYLIGHPAEDERDGDSPTVAQFVDRLAPTDEPPGIDLQSLCWKVYSAREVTQKDSVLKVAGREFDENECVVVRVWRPHPADVHAADSPVRAVLPLLRELEALTKLISAQADSTLAGNGVFVVPDAVSVLGGTAPEDSPDVDPFIVDLMDAMMTPISNRDAASSLVPLVVTLPDEMPWQPFHISFARPLDSAAMDMRTELIRRLALGLDAPPEVLMGNGASNHWCRPETVKALGRDGWIQHSDLNVGDEILTLNQSTACAEWQPVQAVYRAPVTSEPMVRLSVGGSRGPSRQIDATLGHRFPVIRNGVSTIVLGSDLRVGDVLTVGAPVMGLPEEATYSDSLVQLAAWYSADGTLTGTEGRPGQIRIGKSWKENPDKVARMTAVLTQAFGPAKDSMPRGIGPSWRMEIQDRGMAVAVLNSAARDLMLGVIPGKEKIIPVDFVRKLTRAQLDLFIDAWLDSDGQHRAISDTNAGCIWQRNPDRLDALEMAAVLAGRSVRRETKQRNSGFSGWGTMHLLSVGSFTHVNIRQIERTEYTGTVWCPTTANGTWLSKDDDGWADFTGNSAWQIAEDFVKLHIMPVIGLIRDALVREYLRPVLEANGITNPQDYTIEADASALTLRPNRSAEALQLNAAGLITDAAAREALGFGEEDAPEESARMDEAVSIALELVKDAPSLAQDPGLPALVAQIRAVLAGETIDPAPEPVEPIEEPEAEIPTVVDPGPPAGEGEAAA